MCQRKHPQMNVLSYRFHLLPVFPEGERCSSSLCPEGLTSCGLGVRLFGSLPQSCQSTPCISTLFGECNSFPQPGWSVSTMQRWQHSQALLWLSLLTVTSCLAPWSEPSFPSSSLPRPSSSKHSAKAQQYHMKDLTMLTMWSTPHATSTTSPGIVTWIRHTRADCFSRWDFLRCISHFSFSLLLNIPVAFAGTYTYESIIWKTQRKQVWAPEMLVHWAVKHSCSALTKFWKGRKGGLTSRQHKNMPKPERNPDNRMRICPSTTRISLFSHQQGQERCKNSTLPKAVFALMLGRPSPPTSPAMPLSLVVHLKLKESRGYKWQDASFSLELKECRDS